MKCIVLIFTIILPFILGEGKASSMCDSNHHCTDAVVQCSASDATDNKVGINDAATIPIKTRTFLVDGNNLAILFSPSNSGRRTQPSFNTSFGAINTSKVFGRNNLYIFQFFILHFQYRLRSNSRYLYIICQLLI